MFFIFFPRFTLTDFFVLNFHGSLLILFSKFMTFSTPLSLYIYNYDNQIESIISCRLSDNMCFFLLLLLVVLIFRLFKWSFFGLFVAVSVFSLRSYFQINHLLLFLLFDWHLRNDNDICCRVDCGVEKFLLVHTAQGFFHVFWKG